jgi:hypothetical protein
LIEIEYVALSLLSLVLVEKKAVVAWFHMHTVAFCAWGYVGRVVEISCATP